MQPALYRDAALCSGPTLDGMGAESTENVRQPPPQTSEAGNPF